MTMYAALRSSLLAALVLAPAVRAAQVDDIRVMEATPLAPRGGVMMIPLSAGQPGDEWPSSLEVGFADGREVRGRIVWVYQNAGDPDARRSWTEEAGRLAARSIEPSDDTSSASGGAPYLVVKLPDDGKGRIRIGNQTLSPMWADPNAPYAGTPLPGEDRPLLPRTVAPYRPDASSPFAHWRWVLLADRLDLRPPPPDDFEGVGALVAQHYADVWRISLHRVGQHSPGVASACRDLLTRVCHDPALGGGDFAAWVSDPDDLSTLLTTLLNFRAADDDVLRDALAWADSRRALLGWVEGESAQTVRVAFINRTFEPVVARFAWEGADDLPLAVEIEPEVLTRIDIDRPPLPEAGPLELKRRPEEPREQVLRCVAPHQALRFVFGPRVVPVRPPGAGLPPFLAPLSLAEVEAGRQRLVPERIGTAAQVRRLHDRWEVFFECRRPGRGAQPLPEAGAAGEVDTLTGFDSWGTVRNVESITLLIGPERTPRVALTVPEFGWYRLFTGTSDGTLQVHRKSYSDRWYCRLVLPNEWLSTQDEGEAVLLGALRTHEWGDAMEMTPTRSVPWRVAPGRVAMDLEAWIELPE